MLYIPTSAFERLPQQQQVRYVELKKAEAMLVERKHYEGSLAEFTKASWHTIESVPLLWNWHLDVVCAYLEAFFEGRIKHLILNIPPGSMKSILLAVMGPAWMWAKRPEARLISITNEIGLATRDNRRMKQVIMSDWYRRLWGGVYGLSRDQQEKTLFENDKLGFRQGLGIGGNITGKRGNFLLLDDLVDAKKAFSDVTIATAIETMDQGIMSRLNNPTEDGIALIMQRLRTNDPTGHLLAKKHTKWVHVRIPQEYEGTPGYDPVKDLGPQFWHLRDPRKKPGDLMFEQRIPPYVIRQFKEDLGEYGYAGQHQQRPSPLSGGIIKRGHWKIWPKDKPLPRILHTFASWDTAFTEIDFKSNAYSARTDWGVWQDPEDIPPHARDDEDHTEHKGRYKLLLLAAWWKRVDFDDLLLVAEKVQKRRLHKVNDAHLIEAKASGQSLIQVMRRRATLRILSFDPKTQGGGDKIARAYSVQGLFRAGLVWCPDRPWAVGTQSEGGVSGDPGVIDIISAFPTGAPPCSDLTDTVTQALRYLDNGWWIHHPDDDLPPPADDRLIGIKRDPFERDQYEDDDGVDVDGVTVRRKGGIYG